MYIGVYRTKFPIYSETFISEQVSSYTNKVCVICRDNLTTHSTNQNYQTYSVISGFFSKLMFTMFGYVSRKKLTNFSSIDILHAHFGQDGYYAMHMADKLKIPFVVTFHGQDCTVSDYEKIKSLQVSNLLYVLNKKKIFKKASKIIAVSDFVKNELIKSGCDEEKIVVKYIGVDIDRFQYRESDDNNDLIHSSEIQILSVGRHTEKKGLAYLLEALSLCDVDFKLTQIGKGELTSLLDAKTKELELTDKIQYMGSVDSDIVNCEMQKTDIFIVPSIQAANGDSEAFGIVFIEAAAVGIPVISTFHGGIPEAVENGVTGILVPERNASKLAEAINKLSKDKKLRLEMGRNGRKRVESHFDIQIKTKELELLYEGILNASGR